MSAVIPKIYHPYRKRVMVHLGLSIVTGMVFADLYWRFYAAPKVERRNFVMSLIEKERLEKKEALALAEMEFPAQGEIEDLHK